MIFSPFDSDERLVSISHADLVNEYDKCYAVR